MKTICSHLFLFLAFCSPQAIAENKAESGKQRSWTPQDSIAIRTFEAPLVSPDGRFFFYVYHYGEWTSDSNISELHVYDADQVRALLAGKTRARRPLEPFRKATMSSSSSVYLGIADAQWDSDTPVVLFVGQTAQGRQVLRLDVQSGAVEQLTHEARSVTAMTFGGPVYVYRGSGLIYGSLPSTGAITVRYPMEAVVRDELGVPLSPDYRERQAGIPTIHALYQGRAAQLPPLRDGLRIYRKAWLSPTGRMGVGLAYGPSGGRAVMHFIMIDVEHARVELPDMKVEGWGQYPGSELRMPEAEALWSADGKRVILVNATVPHPGSPEEPAGSNTPYIVEYEINSGRWKILEPLMDKVPAASSGTAAKYVSSVGWLKEGEELLVTHEVGGQPSEGTVYVLTPSGVKSRTVEAPVKVPVVSMTEGLSLRLAQGANEPPRIVASDGKREVTLTPPDPSLKNLWRGQWQPFTWHETDNKIITGALMLPRGFRKDSHVPLVIQAYWYKGDGTGAFAFSGRYLPDGLDNGTSDAAQSLVARGFAVLWIDAWDRADSAGTAREGPFFVQRVDAAVEALSKDGYVDPTRVGLTGFSRGGYVTYYTITHPGRTQLGAVVCADSFDGSYTRYLIDYGPESWEAARGGSFWQKKQEWLEHETTFNVDNVRTPALFTRNAKGYVPDVGKPYGWNSLQTIGAFLLNKRPIEYLYFPEGDHLLIRPRERVALQEAVVDWMSFWLQGTAPADAERTMRWLELRAQQEAMLAAAEKNGHKLVPLPPLVSKTMSQR